MRPRYTRKYTMTWGLQQWDHMWQIEGADGGAHLSIRPWKHHDDERVEHSAGLEMHFRRPPAHMTNEAPTHSPCWLIHGPCWHDGTSLYASENFVPMFLDGCDHERIFSEMESWADAQLEKVPE